jgi:oligoribonuclease NrnB/cAMP/cGMP phosphodiesterase (DHH superfamily)
MNKTPLVIYHGDCFDGFAAAWAFRHFYGKSGVDYHAAIYGQDPPDCKGRRVWLVDFSYPREILLDKVLIPSIQTTVYDHHKTAEKALEGVKNELWERGIQRDQDKIVFDMKRSGAGITYDEMEVTHGKKRGFHLPRYNDERKERLIDYIEDRDLWKFKLEDSQEIAAYVSTVPFTFEAYDELAEDLKLAPSRSKVVEKGAAILKYIDLYGDKACDLYRVEEIGGWAVPVINVPYMNCSEHIGKLAEKHPEAPFAAGFFKRSDGKWQFGLRSRGEFDVSDVAKQYGGGGHKQAAGFQVNVLPWDKEPMADESPPKGHLQAVDVVDDETGEKVGEATAAIPTLTKVLGKHFPQPIDAQGIKPDSEKGKVSIKENPPDEAADDLFS